MKGKRQRGELSQLCYCVTLATHTGMHTHTHIYIRAQRYTCMHAHLHTKAHVWTYTHGHTAFMYTGIQIHTCMGYTYI